MKTLLIACLTATLFFTSPPARAQGMEAEQIGGILAGLLTLGLIAKAIDDRNDREDRAAAVARRAPDFAPRQGGNRRYLSDGLPERCLARVDLNGRDRHAYSRHCLKRNYRFADRLPQACERKVRTDRGWRTVYGARCLRRSGFETVGHRGRD